MQSNADTFHLDHRPARHGMSVSEAIDSRMSCRAFLDRPVPRQTIVSMLETAKRAPSGGNLQPWIVQVLTGAPLKKLLGLIRDKLAHAPAGEGAEYEIYPPHLHDPYRSRRFKCGEDMYATIDVSRDDKLARGRQFARNYALFGAPVGLFFMVDRRMGPPQWADIGMFMQNLMLLAREYGLHTCPQEAWAMWRVTVGRFLHLPPEQMLFCGMALGYRDEDAPINTLRTDRAALDEFAVLRGFD